MHENICSKYTHHALLTGEQYGEVAQNPVSYTHNNNHNITQIYTPCFRAAPLSSTTKRSKQSVKPAQEGPLAAALSKPK